MIRLLLLSILSISLLTAKSQVSLTHADSLNREYFFYHWRGSNKIYLTRFGTLERQFPEVIFTSMVFKKDSGLLILTGFINTTGDKHDTISVMKGLPILLARRNNAERLSKIRRFGTTADDSTGKMEGSFYLRMHVNKNDVLLIGQPGTNYWGAVIVPVGKLVQ